MRWLLFLSLSSTLLLVGCPSQRPRTHRVEQEAPASSEPSQSDSSREDAPRRSQGSSSRY